MAFEFAFLDWLQQFAHPVMDALAVFFNWAGMHGELWILFGVILLLRRSTRKAGLAMLLALLFYLLVGDMILKPLFARPRPCEHPDPDFSGAAQRPLVPVRTHQLGLCSRSRPVLPKQAPGHPRFGAGCIYWFYPPVPVRPLPHRRIGGHPAGAYAGRCRIGSGELCRKEAC